MKIKSIIAILGLIFGFCSIAAAHPSYTGYSSAPGCRGTCSSSCHGSSGGSIEISGFPTEYVPGETYTVEISHAGGSSIKNLNGSCRIGSGSDNAGVISAGTNTSTYNRNEETNGVHLSTNNHDDATFLWTAPESGTGEVTLYIAGHQGSYSGQNTRISLTANEQATGIDEHDSGPPSHFALLSNYPNPFNAATVIKYSLPQDSEVKVEVFDMLGRKIQVLVDQQQQAGNHSIVWDGSQWSSGVYFYRVQADNFSQTMRMTLLK